MRRSHKGLPRIAWIGLALLLMSAVMFTLGERESLPEPGSDRYAPSGAAAFRELLQRNGYDVVTDFRPRPRLRPGDIAIAFEVARPTSGLFGQPEDSFETEEEELDTPYKKTLHNWLDRGGKAIVLSLPIDFMMASRLALAESPWKVAPISGSPLLTVSSSESVIPTGLAQTLLDYHASVSLWKRTDNEPFVTGIRVGAGTALLVADGLPATNRFLDKGDNADFLLALVRVLGPPGTRVVFTEASWGNEHAPSIVQAIGPWANAAWQQLLLLSLVIVMTLGKRLGLPEQVRGKQRGSRELVDALGNTMLRGRFSRLALEVALRNADTEIRLALKLPRDADRQKRDERLPHELRQALVRAEVAAGEPRLPPGEALKRLKELDAALGSFLGERRPRRTRRATIVS